MVMDCHPLLLTVGMFGLTSFGELYHVFLEGNNVNDAISHLLSPADEIEKRIIINNIDIMLRAETTSGYRDIGEKVNARRQAVYDVLPDILGNKEIPVAREWFIAFHLAVAKVLGRTFPQRISPAIFYDRHSVSPGEHKVAWDEVLKINEEVIQSFLYEKELTIIRDPICRYGSDIEWNSKRGKHDVAIRLIWTSMVTTRTFYVGRGDPAYDKWRIIRFEDVKLHPRETLSAMCDFLRLPWSDTFMTCTINGEANESFLGTHGYDLKPVYNRHEKYLGFLDAYRIEMLHGHDYESWGYKLKYYDGAPYSEEDLLRLVDLPYKCEMYFSKEDQKFSQEWHKLICEAASKIWKNGREPVPFDNQGRKMVPVEWLRPQLPEGERMYE